jgi:hypothetical protein
VAAVPVKKVAARKTCAQADRVVASVWQCKAKGG